MCTVAALSLVIVPFDAARPARAAETPIPFATFADMHVDYARRHVFVSGGSGTNAVFVFGFDGRQVARIDGLAGAADLLPDGDLLYVALSNADEIAVVNVKTLDVTDRLEVSPYAQPVYLSKSRDTIYFTHSCSGYMEGEMASVDLSTRVPVPHEDNRLIGCMKHAVVPTDENTMFAWDSSGYAPLRRFNVTARQPVFLDESPGDERFDDLEFSSDGETFYVRNTMYGAGIDQRRLGDYSVVMNYPRAGAAYGLTPDEDRLFATTNDYDTGDLAVYRTGSPAPLTTMELDGAYYSQGILPGALAAGPAGDRVFAVGSRDYYDSNLAFRVIWPQYRVAAGGGSQTVPAAGNGYETWTNGGRRVRNETLLARGGGRTFRVNPLHTSGYGGGIDGNRLVYQIVRGRRSDLRLYDLKKRRQISTLDRMNTRAWEWHPTISGGRVLFSRQRGNLSQVILQPLGRGRARVLAAERSRTSALIAGQVNGRYATWTWCGRTCEVVRMNLATGNRLRAPRPARRINYGGSVKRDGTLYYVQSGFGCGTNAAIMRFAGGRVTEIDELGTGKDAFFTYADGANDRVLFDEATCTYRGTGSRWDVLSFRDIPTSRDRGGKPSPEEEAPTELPPLEGEPWFGGLLPGGP